MAGGDSSLRVVLLGPPGSGKGTQAKRLCEELGVPHVSTGDMLRDAVAAGSELGRRVEGIMRSGELVDDRTMAEVVRERLAKDDARDGFILDGYPRNLSQAETLDAILEASGADLDAVVFLDVPEEELVRRALGRKRADDTEEVIRERLRIFREQTEPLIGHYEERGLLEHVDGLGTVEEITGRIEKVLDRASGV